MRQSHFYSLGPDGFHRIAYTDWGDAANPHVVACVHDLARNGRDFDFLADVLQMECRVACMDVVGRGASDWLRNKSNYKFGTYLADAAAFIARVTAPRGEGWLEGLRSRMVRRDMQPRLDWVGTSMGGPIGMLLAAKPGSPIRRLVLKDVGPLVPWSALFRIKGYVARDAQRFASIDEVEAYLRTICATFGPLADSQWRHLAVHSARRLEQGGYGLRYDPNIGQGLHGHYDPEFPLGPDILRGIDLWDIWKEVDCRTLVLRGGDSDVLSPATLEEMRRLKPDLEVVEFAGVGHAPALMSPDQVAAVRDFLLRP